jgi:pSer/pThr/pTyr-binding forkhead associated (FHA) protein
VTKDGYVFVTARTLLVDPYEVFRQRSAARDGITAMTTTAPDRRAAGLHPTEPLDVPGVLSPRALRDSLAFDRPAPGRYLVLEEGTLARLVPLREPIMHIGRGFAVDMRLEDQSVSRRHAIIVERDGELRILDDRSANGTFVNGRRVAEATLHDRDVIRIGGVSLHYIDVAG